VVEEAEEKGRPPASLLKEMGNAGLLGLAVPEQYGGGAGDSLAIVLLSEELARASGGIAVTALVTGYMSTPHIAKFGTDAQRARYLPGLVAGDQIASIAVTEPGTGSNVGGITTRATQVDGGFRLNGTKMFITNAGTPISLGVTILAVTGTSDDGKKRYGTFFIPEGTPGYEKGNPLRKLGWHAMDTRELVFRDCWIPDENLIGEEGNGLRQFLEVLDAGRISVAALGLSLAQTALDLALKHATEREQFGSKLSRFQAIGHKLADMATEIEAARALVYRAAWLGDQGRPFAKEAAMAKLYTSEVANRAASASVQIHGGYGYVRESAISRFYADAKVLEIGEGTSEIQRNVIARALTTPPRR
jgi:short-chain 2-methylacyl-CoA dehydrogenase